MHIATITNHQTRTEFVHQIWPADPQQLSAIRRDVRRWLGPLALSEQARRDLLLAVVEAASNAIEHAYAPAASNATLEVTFWTEPGTVNVEITDHGRWQPPAPRPMGRGLGIALMQRLIDSVAIHFDRRGTRILLTHPLPGRERPAPPACDRPTSLQLL
jgi:anti-sigma regulatory factor (Ser/Thr protein kinase)